ncbi:MAG: glycosyltransferase family 2 protein [Planctomycetota bacterium]|nr:glycosyltransferase family 2 protein [Planctomycetota bacterium]MDA1178701.1 glycosyltransferase family 2 protein [Planctomycetota bacterium]
MYPAISVLIPLRNAEKSAAVTLLEVMDIVGELCPSFEILLVDDGSIDETAYALAELSRRYPQVRAISSPRQRGFVEAVQAGLEIVTGDFVFIQDGAALPSSSAYRNLWQTRQSAVARSAGIVRDEPVKSDAWLERLVAWGIQISGGVCRVDIPSGLQMIRRNGAHPIRAFSPGTVGQRNLRHDGATPPVVIGTMHDLVTGATVTRAN